MGGGILALPHSVRGRKIRARFPAKNRRAADCMKTLVKFFTKLLATPA
jgi:hypothetical protein